MLFQKNFGETEKTNIDTINTRFVWENKIPEVCMPLAKARETKCKKVRINNCEGKISGEFIYLYPPGIPIIVPGERINQEIINQILQYKKLGLSIQGMEDKTSEYLMVCIEE
jgi:arginine/lysine/ornithine decarboxylase